MGEMRLQAKLYFLITTWVSCMGTETREKIIQLHEKQNKKSQQTKKITKHLKSSQQFRKRTKPVLLQNRRRYISKMLLQVKK